MGLKHILGAKNLPSLSVFIVTMSISGVAAADPCDSGSYFDGTSCVLASPGSYVSNAGATVAELASPGHYVSTSGATRQSDAQAGYYVPNSGATFALPSPIGSYVSGAAASAATLAGSGYYVPVTGASSQAPAGLLAGPLTTAMRATSLNLANTQALIDSKEVEALKASFYYESGSVTQDGLNSTNKLKSNIAGVSVVADVWATLTSSAGFFVNVGSNKFSAASDGSGRGNSYTLGAYSKVTNQDWTIVSKIVAGVYDFDSTRYITNINSPEVARGTTRVGSYGLNFNISHPWVRISPAFSAYLDISALSFAYKGMTETAVAGSGSGVYGLRAASLHYFSIPMIAGGRYTFGAASSNPVTLSAGYRADLAGRRNILVSSPYSFNVPVNATSTNGAVLGVTAYHKNLADGFILSASAQADMAARGHYYQGALRLSKAW